MPGPLETHDLRHTGTADKRVHNQKAKWSHGGRPALAHPGLFHDLPSTRPAKPESTVLGRRQRTRNIQHIETAAKIDLRKDVREALDAGTSEPSAGDYYDLAEFQDEAVAHPYEVNGETIFKNMVDKAIEKFEIKETEKLVKEYEFITRESEISIGYLAADDDDFELVDRYQL
ncbi:hypothetical protein BJX63DRAFT_429153 [Aspergillus granulosus]|uniref:Uncharacterized protein n=1 Tax=Aspergillus granulosus TaxID=176169 RepID=A0ABR4HVD5_9EURO